MLDDIDRLKRSSKGSYLCRTGSVLDSYGRLREVHGGTVDYKYFHEARKSVGALSTFIGAITSRVDEMFATELDDSKLKEINKWVYGNPRPINSDPDKGNSNGDVSYITGLSDMRTLAIEVRDNLPHTRVFTDGIARGHVQEADLNKTYLIQWAEELIGLHAGISSLERKLKGQSNKIDEIMERPNSDFTRKASLAYMKLIRGVIVEATKLFKQSASIIHSSVSFF